MFRHLYESRPWLRCVGRLGDDMNYNEFLHSKVQVAPVSGFEVRPEDVHPVLKPHQRDAVIWACKGGRRALFESFGLGKTVQELEWCRLVAEHEHAPVLIVLPLGVRQEFSRDAEKSSAPVTPIYTLEPRVQFIFAAASGHSCRRARKITNCAVRI